jgi:tRNA nucleotidyltransferase (CCA-adding enzyme)
MNTTYIPQSVIDVISALQVKGHKAYMVGGCVRDMMRGAIPKDWDVATSAKPEEVVAIFPKVIPTGIEHGTVTVMIETKVPGLKEGIEVTTFRSEGAYTDGRRPDTVTFETDIEADLSRRDFTINAMAYDPSAGVLVDPFGGAEDLKERLVRCVRKAEERFGEDGLRIIRAIRFATTLNFTLDEATANAIAGALPVFEKVSMERKRDEFLKILTSTTNAVRGVSILHRQGLLKLLVPELTTDQPVFALSSVSPVIETRLAVLLSNVQNPRPALERLKLPTKTIERVLVLIAHKVPPKFNDTNKKVREWIRDVGPSERSLEQQFEVCEALDFECSNAKVRAEILRKDPLTVKQLAVTGDDVMAVVGKGKAVGEGIRFLMDKVLADPTLNTKEKLLGLLPTGPA